ncbi:MAG: fatty acid desaturase [Lentisphaerae bacterium]|nr:fatty acid desaturase [Lentisphaerota bacterium]
MNERKAVPVPWYRTPLAPEVMDHLHSRSDFLGALQTLTYLAMVLATGTSAFLALGHLPWYGVAGLVFLHGMCCSFMINAVHELGHRTVFKTNALNDVFVRLFAFIGWINFDVFRASHARHHRYTLHPPDDLEVTLPIKIMVKHFFQQGLINPRGLIYAVKDALRIARGKFAGPWELTFLPESEPELRRLPIRWARTMLAGHAAILLASVALALTVSPRFWLLPVLTSMAPFYGAWLFFLCNNTQHVGLQDKVNDFRLCCRTFTLNPVVRVLYWHMNFHTEHHMYPAVPCYRLATLHRLIKHELPPCPRGIVATWLEIAAILKRQKTDPTYQHIAPLPTSRTPPVAS